MLRLRCYVFAKLVRDMASRELTREEVQYLKTHRTECAKCQLREDADQCSLDSVRSIDDDFETDGSPANPGSILDGTGSKSGSILDNLGFNILQH